MGVAFVFSGQGDPFPGIGKNFYDASETARNIFDSCDAIRPGTAETCFSGTAEELKQTAVTQPCLYAMELAAAAALRGEGVISDAVAGFSLGELMQQESEKFDTSMAAVLKLSGDQVCALCGRDTDLYPVNFNCPGQIAVSGLREQLAPFLADVKEAGGRGVP